MHKSCAAALLLILTPVYGSASYAQETYPLEPEPGTRVRVSLLDRDAVERSTQTVSTLTGTISSWSDDSFVLETEGTERQIRRDRIAKLEVSLGEKSNAGKGAWIGALGGLAIGLAAGLACTADGNCAAATEDAVVLLGSSLVIGLVGTGLGGGIGAAIKSERWQEYADKSPSSLETVSLGRSGRFQLAFSLRL